MISDIAPGPRVILSELPRTFLTSAYVFIKYSPENSEPRNCPPLPPAMVAIHCSPIGIPSVVRAREWSIGSERRGDVRISVRQSWTAVPERRILQNPFFRSPQSLGKLKGREADPQGANHAPNAKTFTNYAAHLADQYL